VNNKCKVCGYDMPYPPVAYNICPCCGIEYGLDDAFDSYQDFRDNWLREGGKWFSRIEPHLQPNGWNAWDQLERAGLSYAVPRPSCPSSISPYARLRVAYDVAPNSSGTVFRLNPDKKIPPQRELVYSTTGNLNPNPLEMAL
jgi:hypothetical protein